MAECGSSNLEYTEQLSVNSCSLECPICQEQFQQPKSLPCLHSFCQECLSSYIIKELSKELGSQTSFSCPVCQKIIKSTIQSEDVSTWFQQFPTNCLDVELLESQQHCTPCKIKENTNVPAEFWCRKNKNFFCKSCKTSLHDYVHIKCDVIELKEGTFPMLKKNTVAATCEAHGKQNNHFCEEHHVLGCKKCIIVYHRRCEEVKTTEDYVRKLKENSRIENMSISLNKGIDAMESLVTDFKQQLESLIKDREIALKSIEDLRQEIDRRLDKMQQEITKELIAEIEKINYDLETSKETCERMRIALQNTLKTSESGIHNDNHTETILLFQRGQAEISACKNVLMELKKSFTSVNVKHTIPSDLTAVSRNTVFNIGKIDVQKSLRNFPVAPCKDFVPLAECSVKEKKKINIKCPSDDNDCASYGVVYLPSGLLVVSDFRNSKLKLFSENGDYLDELKVSGSPVDMCLVDNLTVAVVTQTPNAVRVAKVESSKLSLSSEISCPDGLCLGVTYADGYYFVIIGRDVFRINTDCQAERIEQCDTGCYHLAYDQKERHLLSSHASSHIDDIAVTKIIHDEVIDVMKVGVIKGAVGVDVDVESNIYVCGFHSNNVVQLSSDGTKVRELLTSADDIQNPRAISVCDDKFVMTNESFKQRNYIRLFEFI